MKYSTKFAALAAFLLSTGSVFAAPVDLSTWMAEGGGNWNVANPPDSVLQTINGNPAVFHNKTNSQGKSLEGTIKVETTGDDDFVGFVLGYDNGELSSTAADFWLIDWKQGNQGLAKRGLALSHVFGDVSVIPNDGDPGYWDHTLGVNEVARATNLGDTGWLDNTEYNFKLTFTASLIEVFVNDVLEISYSGSFTDGAFGFYNYSQGSVRYAGIEEEELPPPEVPLPAGLPMLLAGLGALGVMARKRKA